MPDCGVKRAAGSCTPIGEGAAEGLDFETDGGSQRANSPEVIHEIPVSPEEAILGKSFLGKRILRGYGWS